MGYPVDALVELRGVQPASEFVDKKTGQLVQVPARAKVEHFLPNGDVVGFELSGSALDKAVGTFDFNTARRGDFMRIVGETRDGERGHYLAVAIADAADAPGAELHGNGKSPAGKPLPLPA